MATVYSMDSSGRMSIINTSILAGNTVANNTGEVTFAEPQPVITPLMWYVGRSFDIHLAGSIGTSLVLPSIRGKIKLNSTIIGDTGFVGTLGNLSGRQWTGWIKLNVLTVGSSGTVEVQGAITVQTGSGIISLPIMNSDSITINMTQNQTLTFTAQWGALSLLNTITLRQFTFKG